MKQLQKVHESQQELYNSFACEMSKQVCSWSISGSTETCSRASRQSVIRSTLGLGSYLATYTLSGRDFWITELHWDRKCRIGIFLKNSHLLSVLVMPLVLSLRVLPELSSKAQHSGRFWNSIHKIYPSTVDVSPVTVLRITFISVLQRAGSWMWQGLLLLTVYPRC